MEIWISVILFLWLVALLYTQYKGRQKYKVIEHTQLIGSDLEEGKLEKILRVASVGVLVVFVTIVLWGVLKGYLDESIMLYLVATYLFIYYALEYICHHRWCFTEEGLCSSRQLEIIGFEKIVSFTWYERPHQLILRVNYKGRGIVTRKSDYVVPENKRREVEKLLKNKVIITRG